MEDRASFPLFGDRSQTLNRIEYLGAAVSQDVSEESSCVRQSGKAYGLVRIYALITCEHHHMPS